MKRIGLVPLALLAGLIATYGVNVAIGWYLVKHCGFSGGDPYPVPGTMDFRAYLASRFFVWDGQWYDTIAKVGYVWHPSTTVRQSLAFFPLWGLIIRPIYEFVPHYPRLCVVALTVLVAYGSIHLFFLLGRRLIGDSAAVIATALYVFYPAGHFLLQSYPTGLMNLAALLVLRDLLDGREWRPALIAGIATAAGPLMVAAGFTVWLLAAWKRRARLLEPGALLVLLGLGLLALSGLLAFVGWQAVALHNPFAFLMAQEPWDQKRSLALRLWRFTWIMLVVPDLVHMVNLGFKIHSYLRWGDHFRAYIRYEFLVNFLFMTLLMVGLFWTIGIKPRLVLLYGALSVVFYVWFHATTHSGLGTMRLMYICIPGFWGLGRALQSERIWTFCVVGVSVAALFMQEICTDVGWIVS